MTGLLSILPNTITILFVFYLGCKCADFILGILKTWKNPNSYRSRIMRDGIIRWVAELVAIVFVIAVDIVLGTKFLLISSALGLFIYKETGSICENLHHCGVDLPKFITDRLEVFNPDAKEQG